MKRECQVFRSHEFGAGVVHTRLGVLFAVVALPLWAIALGGASRNDITVTMYSVSEQGIGQEAGRISITETSHGVVFTPNLSGLPRREAGLHGFHIHERGDCGPKGADGETGPALAAGGHYDPDDSGKHGSPWGDGHLGDLPPLFVDAAGRVTQPVLAPRLTQASALRGRALVVHAGGDNHADQPQALGGGGTRMLCGVIR